MNITIDSMSKNQLLLVLAKNAASDQMLELTAALGVRGRVQVIDGGNHFNVYKLAKYIRRRTPKLESALQKIKISRCFNCFQTVTQICENVSPDMPILILDLLCTFYDEDVSLKESKRLLIQVIEKIDELCKTQPVIISARPPRKLPERQVLFEILKNRADSFLEIEQQVKSRPQQTSLLSENTFSSLEGK